MPRPGDVIAKDPNADLPYAMDWGDWLEGNEVITASIWTVDEDSGLTLHRESFGNGRCVVWLAGGTAGSRPYRVTNRVETNNGKEDDRSFFVWIKER